MWLIGSHMAHSSGSMGVYGHLGHMACLPHLEERESSRLYGLSGCVRRVAFLQDATMTCKTAPNLAAVLAGGIGINERALQDYLHRIKWAISSILYGCKQLKARRFTEAVKANYKKMTGEGYPIKGTTMHPIRLMLDQAVVGAALARGPSRLGEAVDVQHDAGSKPPEWRGVNDQIAYLRDTVVGSDAAEESASLSKSASALIFAVSSCVLYFKAISLILASKSNCIS